MYLDDLIGIPYKDHGRDESGMDCYGLILEIARRRGIHLRDFWYDPKRYENITSYKLLPVHQVADWAPGRVVEIDYKGRLHLGYVLDDQRMIHTTTHGVCVSPVNAYHVRGVYAFDEEETGDRNCVECTG
jgi:cell wall-associated NlpC family hydrolase